MKSSNLFWGFFFISFGSLYLVARYSNFVIDWWAIWELWPILIILAGIAIIIKGTMFKPILAVLFGILLAFLAFGFFNDLFDVFENRSFHRDRWWRDYSENYYNMEYDEAVKEVNLNINAGAGKFYIEKTTDNLIKGYSKANIGEYDFVKNITDSVANITLSMEDVTIAPFSGKFRNQFKLSLNENPTYNLDLDIGAAKSSFNLIPFKVKYLSLETGATDTKIKLGDKLDSVSVKIDMGAAALKIYIPETSGCRLKGDMVLMSKDLRGFRKYNSDLYITENYDSAKSKIFIDLDGGVASLDVKRY